MSSPGFSNIGVIGAGTMGISLAADLVLHNIDVVLIDISVAQLATAHTQILELVRFAPLLDRSAPRVEEASAANRITCSTVLQDIQHCEFIIENVTESLPVKTALYKALSDICANNTCIGVNTSCTSITQMAAFTSCPDKVVGVHFMNPVPLKKTVEVIRGYHTSDTTLAALNQLLQQLGKEAIVVNDYPGFVSNRISHLFMNEAAFVLQDQVATTEQIDAIFKKCYGHTMGPLETADLIGLDTVVNSLEVLYESYQDPKFRCCPLLKKMVNAGLLGRKTGKGFYTYNAGL